MNKEQIYEKLEKVYANCSMDYIYLDMEQFDEQFTKEFGEDNATYITFEPENDTYNATVGADTYIETCISLQNRGKKITGVATEYLGDVLVTVITYK